MINNRHKTNLANTEKKLITYGKIVKKEDKYRVPPNLIFSLLTE